MKTIFKAFGILVGLLLIGAVAFYLTYLRGVERPKLALKPIEFSGKEMPGQHDCFWIGPVTIDSFNTAFPDEGAIYWPTVFTYPDSEADSHLEITGTFPRARYMSFHTYTTGAVPYTHLNDLTISPDDGSENPFVTGQFKDGQSYTFNVYPGTVPDTRPANAMYLGPLDQIDPTPIILRNYVPEVAGDPSGGAGLPKVALVRQDGTRVEGQDLCDLLQSPAVGDANRSIAAPVIPQEDYTRLMSKPEVADSLRKPAHKEWTVFWDPRVSAMRLMSPDLAGMFKSVAGWGFIKKTSGFFANIDNEYVSMYANLANGPVVVLEGKMPRTPDKGVDGAKVADYDMRYWSLCTNEGLSTTRFTDCKYDSQVTLDDARNYRIVISKAADRPENARAECGVTWMDFGDQGDGGGHDDLTILILRNMLPNPRFTQAVQSIPNVGAEKATMGDYLPIPEYTDTAAFETRGCPAN